MNGDYIVENYTSLFFAHCSVDSLCKYSKTFYVILTFCFKTLDPWGNFLKYFLRFFYAHHM